MKQTESEVVGKRNQRRKFFGQLIAAVGGGFLAGGIIKKALSSGARPGKTDKPISVTRHPLAVPRTKEGPKSNV